MMLVARGMAVQPYEVTPDDVLWLLRAVETEGPDPRQVAAVLVNGFVWNRSRGSKGSLERWVQAYAQPVNPRWFQGGDLLQARLAETTDPGDRAELLNRAHVREHVYAKRTTFHAKTRQAVVAALTGKTRIPERATDYASPNQPSQRIPLEKIPKGRNRLYTREGTEDWEGYAVAGLPFEWRVPWGGVVLGAGIVAAVAWYAWPRRRRERAA